MSETTIALALLKANWDEHHKSYLDNFNLLTAECLRQSTDDVASASQLVRDLKSRFGLIVPRHIAEVLLKRASKTGLLTKQHGVYNINRDVVDNSDFDARKNRVAEAHETLVQKLANFAAETFDVKWSEQQTEGILHNYLNANALDLARATTRQSLMSIPRHASKSEKYILASFVNKAIAEDLSSLAHLKMVVEGTILVSAIFLPNPADTGRRFKDTVVFFDTRFLLEALGHCGESLRDPAYQLLDLLTQHGAHLACFEHTRDEVESVLNACATGLSMQSLYTGYGNTFDHFLQKGFSESDVRLIMTTVKRDLKAIGIEVRRKPEHDKRFTIDENSLQTFIESELQYHNPHALRRDVDSVSAVIRLRRGSAPRELERSRSIFTTSNRQLIKAGNAFFSREVGEEVDLAPVCISEWHLTSLLWLKRPLARPGLPQKRIIADFYAAINPSESFMRRYVDEVDKLEASGVHTAEVVFLLRNSLEARKIAMDLTVGDEDAFTQGTVVEVLEVVQNSLRAKGEAQLAEEQARSARLVQELRDSRSETTEARKREQRDQEFRRLNRERLANRWAEWISLTVVLVVAAILLVAAYLATPLLPLPVALQAWAGPLAAGLVLLTSAANWFWGVNLSGLRRSLSRRIQRFIVGRLDRELEGVTSAATSAAE